MAKPRNPLAGFSTTQIQDSFGVSGRTARRWALQGPPPKQSERVKAFLAAHKPPQSSDVRALLKLPTAELAAFAGVKSRTAQVWKRKKQIPHRTIARLLTTLQPQPEPRKLARGKIRHFEGRVTTGYTITLDLNAELSPTLLAKIAVWAARLPYKRTPRSAVQFVMRCSSTLNIDEALPGRFYQRDRLELSPDETTQSGNFVMSSYQARSIASALRDFMTNAREANEFQIMVKDISLIVSEYRR